MGIKLKLILGLVGISVFGLILYTAAIYYGWFQQESELAIAIMAAGMAIPFTSAFSSVQHYYNGRKRFDLYSRIDTVYLASTTVLLIALLWLEQGLLPLIVVTKLSDHPRLQHPGNAGPLKSCDTVWVSQLQ